MIVITGATGNVGRLVTEEVARRGLPVRLLVRDPARAPALRRSQIAVADYTDRDALSDALQDGDFVFMVSIHASLERRVELHRSFIETAARKNVAHITYLSFVNAGPDALFVQARSHGATEEMLRRSGIAWTSIRTSMYADDIPGWFDHDGVLREPGDEAKASFSYRPEIARAIVATLVEPGHEGRIYDITTRDAVSMGELAELASEATGRMYRYEPATDADWLARWTALGREDWELQAGATSYVALRAGNFDIVSDDYERLTGSPAASIREIVTALSSQLPVQEEQAE